MTDAPPSDARRVVVVSALPPPAGGIGTWTRILFARGVPGFAPELVDMRPRNREGVFVPGRPGLGELRRTLRIYRDLLRALRPRPALVHFNVDPLSYGLWRDLLGAALVRIRGVPVVLHHHGLAAELDTSPFRLRRAVLAALARVPALHVALNEASRRLLAGLAGASRVVALPNFYDETASVPEAQPGARGAPARVLFVGGLTRPKGADLALAVARALPGIELHLYGRPYPEMEAELAHAPPNVVRHGEVAEAQLTRAYAEADLLLMPTLREGFPYAALDAMRAGLPVVATAAGALPEMIVDGRGGRIVAREAEALVEAVRELLAAPERLRAMGRFNRERARRLYAYDVVAEQLAALYERVAAPRAPHSGGSEPSDAQPVSGESASSR